MKRLTSSDAKRIDRASARARQTARWAMTLTCAAMLVACSSSQEGGFWGRKKSIVVTEIQIVLQPAAPQATATPVVATTAPATTAPATAPATTRPTTRPTTAPAPLLIGLPQPTRLHVNLETGAGTFFDDEGRAWHYTLTPQRVEVLRAALAKGDWQTLEPASKAAGDLRFVLTATNAGAAVGQPVTWPVLPAKGQAGVVQIPFNDAFAEGYRVANPLSKKMDLTR